MNPNLQHLQPYPFQKLRQLLDGVRPEPTLSHIDLSVGEPKHPAPAFVQQTLANALEKLSSYPGTQGTVELRTTIADWLQRRFHLNTTPDITREVLPVNGTREALFAFAQCVVNQNPKASTDTDSDTGTDTGTDTDTDTAPLVLMPNPFYQIYEGAALLAGATPHYLPCTADTGFNVDFSAVPAEVWQRCQLIYICSPGNPAGAVIPTEQLKQLIELADTYDFVIASDECYSEIYFDDNTPPPSLLQACAELGRDDYRRCVVFHSLSKRSNLPGLRSGFVAGDGDILSQFLQYRTYHGCAMPIHHQLASIAAWNDEDHVRENRRLYREKFAAVLPILQGHLKVSKPDAGFYLWAETPIADDQFTRQLLTEQHITVVPGRYLARTDANQLNPGENRIRMALVAPVEQCQEAAERLVRFVGNL